MKLLEIVHERLIVPELKATTKNGAIEELVDHLVIEHEIPLKYRAKVLEVIMQREESMSTGMEHNVAIPHGAIEILEDTIGVLGLSHHGIDFDTIDGSPAKIICLVIYPHGAFGAHLKTLSGIAGLLNQESFRSDLLAASTTDEILAVMERSS